MPNPGRCNARMRALRIISGKAALDGQTAPPSPAPAHAVLRPLRVSLGSPDLACARAGGPGTPQNILGHEMVAIVEDVSGDAELAKRWVGKRVVVNPMVVCGTCERCLAGLSGHCVSRRFAGLAAYEGVLAEKSVFPVSNLIAVPAGVDDDRAACASTLAAALRLRQAARVEGKTYVTVLGDGPVGVLAAQLLARANASVRLLGHHPGRFSLCERWGVKHRDEREAGRRHDQDIVIDCTGSPSGLRLALQLVRPRGRVIVKGPPVMIGNGPGWVIDLASALSQELEIVSVTGGTLAEALHALATNAADVTPLISRRFRFADAGKALDALEDRTLLKVVVDA